MVNCGMLSGVTTTLRILSLLPRFSKPSELPNEGLLAVAHLSASIPAELCLRSNGNPALSDWLSVLVPAGFPALMVRVTVMFLRVSAMLFKVVTEEATFRIYSPKDPQICLILFVLDVRKRDEGAVEGNMPKCGPLRLTSLRD